MDGSGTCCGLSLAPRRSYQLRLNVGSQIVRITLLSACVPLLQLNVPRCGAKKHPHNGSQRSKVTELHGIIWSHSGVVCKLWTRHSSLSVIHPSSSPRLYRKQINCSNWGFDLMFLWKWAKRSTQTASHCVLWRYGDTLKCVTHIVGNLMTVTHALHDKREHKSANKLLLHPSESEWSFYDGLQRAAYQFPKRKVTKC